MAHASTGSKVAYSIPLPFGETLDVQESANAWWMDQVVLDRLILALKIGCSLVQACAFAEITPRQYKYFAYLHPKFKLAVKGYRLLPAMQAKMQIVKAIQEGNSKTARWFLARQLPDEYGSPSRRKQTLKRQQIKEAAERRSEDAQLLMDPEVQKLNQEYERRFKELIIRKRKEKSVQP